jgi:hypothetical protein
MTDEIVEVSKSKLIALESVNALKDALWNDPITGPKMKELVKEKYPAANIPEVDIARNVRKVENELVTKVAEKEKAVDEKISAFEKKWADRDAEAAKKEEEKSFEVEVEATKRKYNLTSEGMEKVFARMREKNSPDVEAAAAWVTDHEIKKPVGDSSYTPQYNDLYGSNSGADEWAALNRDPLKYGTEELGRMAHDFKNGDFGKYKEFGGNL